MYLPVILSLIVIAFVSHLVEQPEMLRVLCLAIDLWPGLSPQSVIRSNCEFAVKTPTITAPPTPITSTLRIAHMW